jgi:hypothetical protein
MAKEKQYTGEYVENVLHNQCSQMNVCEINCPYARLNALNMHGK